MNVMCMICQCYNKILTFRLIGVNLGLLMDYRIENLQYGLHSILWVLDKDVHTPGVIPTKCIQRHTSNGSNACSLSSWVVACVSLIDVWSMAAWLLVWFALFVIMWQIVACSGSIRVWPVRTAWVVSTAARRRTPWVVGVVLGRGHRLPNRSCGIFILKLRCNNCIVNF